jgi:hypothetical protein
MGSDRLWRIRSVVNGKSRKSHRSVIRACAGMTGVTYDLVSPLTPLRRVKVVMPVETGTQGIPSFVLRRFGESTHPGDPSLTLEDDKTVGVTLSP